MATDGKRLRPMRIGGTGNLVRGTGNLPEVPERVPERAVAPERVSPSETGETAPTHPDMFIALDAMERQFTDAIADALFALQVRGVFSVDVAPSLVAKEVVIMLKKDARLR